MDDSDFSELACKEWYEQKKLSEISHALDHVLSELDVEPWSDYKQDPEHVKAKIDAAITQINFIQDKLLV